ncbi:MAG: tetratricopeptide repeat protein [Ignavibacteria bacterium]|nr:tetratricopeptide repeat protein [Ignavibacteria bacterium]
MEKRQERKLAAIMFTDIVGYTALMQEDESKARTMRDHLRKTHRTLVAQHSGQIKQFYGDGVLCSFASAIEATRCAVEVQKRLRKKPTIPARIGIHVGDVIFEEEGIVGDGVNVASRIEQVAAAGGVCISEKVYDEIKNQSGLEAKSLGQMELKNVRRRIEIFALTGEGLRVPQAVLNGEKGGVQVQDEREFGKMEAGVKVVPENEVSKKVRRRNKLKKVLIPLSLALILILVLFLLRPIFQEQVAVSSPKPIVVMPFENQTGDESLDYLRVAIPNLLITNLEQSKYLNVATWERMQDLLKAMGKKELEVAEIDKEIGFELCRMDGIQGIVLGSFTKAGDMFATDIKVLDVTSKRLLISANAKGEGVGSILKSQIDELSKPIYRVVYIPSGRFEEEDLKITDVTTQSMEAYRYYLEGVKYYLQFLDIGARVNLEKAVEHDPTFAMAYFYLGMAQRRLGNMQASRVAIEKAMKYSARTTEKEALSIKMDYTAYVERAPQNARKINEELVRRFPKEKMAHYYLGIKYRDAVRDSEAIDAFDRVIELDPNWGYAYNQLGYRYALIGDYAKAREYLEKFASLSPGEPNPFDSMGDLFLMMGRLDDAIFNFKKALEINQTWFAGLRKLAYIYAIKGDYAEALRQHVQYSSTFDKYFSIEEDPGIVVAGYRHGGLIKFLLGRYKEALDLFRRQISLASSSGVELGEADAHELVAFVYAEMGDFVDAENELQKCLETRLAVSSADSLRWSLSYKCISGLFDVKAGKIKSAKEKSKNAMEILPKIKHRMLEIYSFWVALLEGEVALGEALYQEAIQKFRKSTPPNPFYVTFLSPYTVPISRDGLGRAYYAVGDLDKAIAEYRRLITFDPKSEDRFLINPKYHYRLAKLYEEKNWPGLAIQEYEKFLEFWTDADKDLPDLLDAKARLAKLEGMAAR